MLLRMRALTEGARALLYYTAGQIDRAAIGAPGAQALADLLVPLLKAWATDVGVEVASLGIQVHGGMGFIEETGAAQHLRDSRIAPIYEGTNGIQAADLVTRKLSVDDGATLAELMGSIADDASATAPKLAELALECAAIGRWMLDEASLDDRLSGSVPFLTMSAVAVAGWQLLRQVTALQESNGVVAAKVAVLDYFVSAIVPEASGLAEQARAGSRTLYALSAEVLTAR
jgi:hypothetical protein